MTEAPERIWVESSGCEADVYEHPEFGGVEYARAETVLMPEGVCRDLRYNGYLCALGGTGAVDETR